MDWRPGAPRCMLVRSEPAVPRAPRRPTGLSEGAPAGVSIVVVGANHRTAPLDLLERMAIDGDRLPKLLHALDAGSDTSEVVLLATCNRTEVYVVAERFHGAYAEIRDFFSDLTFLPPEQFAERLYVHYDDHAVRHLFEVSAGLDSAVPGEHEILGQVRGAWDLARCEGTARRGLNLLFRHALGVGKRARTETSISRHVTSVSQAGVILAGERLAEVRCGARPEVTDSCTAAGARAGLAGARAVVVGAGRDEAIGRLLSSCRRHRDDADRHVLGRHELRQLVLVADGQVAESTTDLGAVDIEDADHGEATVGEPGEGRERRSQVARTDDHAGPVVVQVELAADLDEQVLDVVADPTGAVGAEVRQVLAHLRSVHTGEVGELLR